MKKKKKKKLKAKVSKIVLPTEKTIIAQSVYEYITLWYGPPGVGKTEFVDKLSDRTFFISTDRGTRYRLALREEVHNWKEIWDVLKALRNQKETTSTYKLVALDHIDDIALMIEDYTCDSLGIEALGDIGYAKGWRLYKKNIWLVLQEVLSLNVGLALIAHETIKTIRTKVIETERMMPDISKSAWKVIIPKCDLVGYMGFMRVKVRGKKRERRIVRTSPTEHIYAKDRTRREKPEEGWELLDGKLFAETFEVKGVTRHVKKKVKKSKKARRNY